MTLRIVHVSCGHCDGTGIVIHTRMTQAKTVLSSTEWKTTRDVASALRIGTTNAANILRDLMQERHVERRGSGARHSPFEWRRRP